MANHLISARGRSTVKGPGTAEDRWSPTLSALAGFAIGALVAMPAASHQGGSDGSQIAARIVLVGLAMAVLTAAATILRNRLLNPR
jgi:hypothetical protein